MKKAGNLAFMYMVTDEPCLQCQLIFLTDVLSLGHFTVVDQTFFK